MVKRETDFPLVKYEICEADSAQEKFRLIIMVAVKRRWLCSQEYSVKPTEAERETIRALFQSRAKLAESRKCELGLSSMRFETPHPPFPIQKDGHYTREWAEHEQKAKEFANHKRQCMTEQQAQTLKLERQVQELTASIPALPSVEALLLRAPIPLSSSEAHGADDYVLHKGTLWSSRKRLQVPDWQFLIEKSLGAEAEKLGRALNSAHPPCSRQTIPAPVRVAVWRRDQGKCTRCGSRERLEYDHIIPVSLGGSNTERNIELLCEVCNRTKRASVALA